MTPTDKPMTVQELLNISAAFESADKVRAAIEQYGREQAYGDAYQGARQDLLMWKRRALAAEQRGSGGQAAKQMTTDEACRFGVWWSHKRKTFTTARQVAWAAWAEAAGRGSGEPVADVDYEAAIEYGARTFKYKQGTGACIAFARGAKWQADQSATTPPRGGVGLS